MVPPTAPRGRAARRCARERSARTPRTSQMTTLPALEQLRDMPQNHSLDFSNHDRCRQRSGLMRSERRRSASKSDSSRSAKSRSATATVISSFSSKDRLSNSRDPTTLHAPIDHHRLHVHHRRLELVDLDPACEEPCIIVSARRLDRLRVRAIPLEERRTRTPAAGPRAGSTRLTRRARSTATGYPLTGGRRRSRAGTAASPSCSPPVGELRETTRSCAAITRRERRGSSSGAAGRPSRPVLVERPFEPSTAGPATRNCVSRHSSARWRCLASGRRTPPRRRTPPLHRRRGPCGASGN